MTPEEQAIADAAVAFGQGAGAEAGLFTQEPALAWEFVQAREVLEGRNIRPEHFLEQYFSSRETVNRLKRELGPRSAVDLLLKNNDNTKRMYKAGVDQIDHHIPETFSPDDVRRMLGI